MLFTADQEKIKHYGMMIMGIGLVFYGMGLMSEAMVPLRSYQPFVEMLESLERPLAGILAGAVFTAIVQSSAATVGIAIAMASEGLLALPAGIGLALGANIGTAVTTAFMGILSSKSTDATRASVVHVTFNILGTIIWFPIIWLLADLAIWISPSSEELSGAARTAAEVPRQIANANTMFNVINTLLFIGFTGMFAKLAEHIVPERIAAEGIMIKPEFLDAAALKAPSIALQEVRLELGRVGAIILVMLQDTGQALKNRELARIKEITRHGDEIDVLIAEILKYMGKLRRGPLTEQEGAEFQGLMASTNDLASITEVIITDIVTLARKSMNINTISGEKTRSMMGELYLSVVNSVELAVHSLRDNDQQAAESVLLMKDTLRQQSDRLLERKALRLNADDPDYLELVRLQMSFIDHLRRIYTLAKRIAKVTLPAVLSQRD
jgi:phosphate:Na+ symporter